MRKVKLSKNPKVGDAEIKLTHLGYLSELTDT